MEFYLDELLTTRLRRAVGLHFSLIYLKQSVKVILTPRSSELLTCGAADNEFV